MGVDMMEVGVHVRRTLIFTIKTCYRSACAHPFVLGIGVFFFLLYRCLPGLFGFLVSSSPVIFCTAVLLGALLSFGNPNIPEVDEEEEEEEVKRRETHHDVSALKAGVVEGEHVVERDAGVPFIVETHVENKEKVVDEKDSGFINERSVEKEETLGSYEERGLPKEVVEKRDVDEEKLVVEDEEKGDEKKDLWGFQVENSRPESELPGTHLEDPFGASQWKLIKDHDESSDSDSDGGESSSPDASMADILPMLDELHPLLDCEPPQRALVSPGDSDNGLEGSHGSCDELSSSEEEVENHEEEEDDDEEEEGKQEGQNDGTKGVVTWTEDDEKNLMDLGNSELERNRRLESLIARRRARKSLRTMVVEKNLIDLDGIDPPFPIAPISTARRNPFDLHYDSNEGMELPPIPGSAPSLMFPRRNPFDLPYGPSEERPNLSGGSFEEEFLTGREKDTYFRRYESFNIGSSYFGESKQDFMFRPYFTTEQASPERMNHPAFHRQMSERSDSKLSAVTEMESVSSTVDHTNFIERKLSQEGELIRHSDHATDHDKPESTSSEEVHADDVDQEIQGDSDADDENARERELTLPDTESTSSVHMKLEVVEETHSGSISSSSEDEKIYQEQTRYETIVDSNNSMQPSDVDPNTRDLGAERVDDSHTKELVYDWNPLEVEKTLSGITIIEEALFYEDKGVLTSSSSRASEMHVNAESSMHNEGIEKETISSNEGQWVASSQLGEVEDNEMRSREVTMISEEDVIKFGFSGDNEKSDELSVPVVPAVVEPGSCNSDSSSSETDSAYERRMSEQEKFHCENDQVPSSSSYTVDVGPLFDVDEAYHNISDSGVSSEDLTHFATEKSLPSLDGDHKVSQESDATNNTQGIVVDEQEDEDSSIPPALGAVPSSIPSEVSENTPTTDHIDLEADFNVRIQQSGGLQETKEIHVTGEEFDVADEIKEIDESLLAELDRVGDFSVEELGTNTNQIEKQFVVGVQESLPELHVLKANSNQEAQEDTHEMVRSNSLLDLQKFHELEAISSVVEQEESNLELQGVEPSSIEDRDPTLKELHQEIEETSILEHDKSKLEEAEGDSEVQLLKQDLIPTKTDLEAPVLETRSVVHYDFISDQIHEEESGEPIAFEPTYSKPILEETGIESVEGKLPSKEANLIETSLELPVLEARSLEDIDSIFEQFRQEETANLMPLESIQNESALEHNEVISAKTKMPNQDTDLTEGIEDLPVLEARTLEDIDSALKLFHEEEVQKPVALESIYEDSILEKTKDGSATFEVLSQHPIPRETSLELPVLEARSLEDIDSALKKLHEEEVKKPVVLESIHEDSILEDTKEESTEFDIPREDPSPRETSLELPVLEARSLEDIDAALKQFHEDEIKKPIVLEPVSDESMLEETKVVPAEFGIPSSELLVLEASSLEDIDTALKQFHEEGVKIPDVLDESMLEENKDVPAESGIPSQDSNPTETNLEVPHDIDPTSEHILEREVQKIEALEPIHDTTILKGTEVESAILIPSDKDSNPADTGVELPSLEARSLEHIDLASMQLHEGNHEKLSLQKSVDEEHHDTPLHESFESESSLSINTDSQLSGATDAHLTPKEIPESETEDLQKPTELENGSTELSAKELESSGEITSEMDGSFTQETRKKIESESIIGETSEVSSSSKTDKEKKKIRSGKSSSSPSSSSSSSSSDSD